LLQESNEKNEKLLKTINANGKIHLVPSKIDDLYFLRFAICSRYTQSPDIRFSWDEVKKTAGQVLASENE
jgi:aromatic-L-amino-acid decarboxylase